jgi:hypothetical protein
MHELTPEGTRVGGSGQRSATWAVARRAASPTKVHVYAWGNNERRAALKGRRCVVEARGAMGTVLVRFLDTGERVTTSFRALKAESFHSDASG